MKILLPILISIYLISSYKKHSSDFEKVHELNCNKIETLFNQQALTGKWYSSNFSFDEDLNFLRNLTDIESPIKYEFIFLKDGNLKFIDLTEDYICSLGILKIKQGSWKVHHQNYLTITIIGEITGDYSFEKEIQYEIIKSNSNELKLSFDNVNKSCEIGYGGTVFIE